MNIDNWFLKLSISNPIQGGSAKPLLFHEPLVQKTNNLADIKGTISNFRFHKNLRQDDYVIRFWRCSPQNRRVSKVVQENSWEIALGPLFFFY